MVRKGPGRFGLSRKGAEAAAGFLPPEGDLIGDIGDIGDKLMFTGVFVFFDR